jgi:hypothetical protein
MATPNQLPLPSPNPIGSTLLVAPKRSPMYKLRCKARIPLLVKNMKSIPPHALCYLIIILHFNYQFSKLLLYNFVFCFATWWLSIHRLGFSGNAYLNRRS